jgi:hypothetical protein
MLVDDTPGDGLLRGIFLLGEVGEFLPGLASGGGIVEVSLCSDSSKEAETNTGVLHYVQDDGVKGRRNTQGQDDGVTGAELGDPF